MSFVEDFKKQRLPYRTTAARDTTILRRYASGEYGFRMTSQAMITNNRMDLDISDMTGADAMEMRKLFKSFGYSHRRYYES